VSNGTTAETGEYERRTVPAEVIYPRRCFRAGFLARDCVAPEFASDAFPTKIGRVRSTSILFTSTEGSVTPGSGRHGAREV